MTSGESFEKSVIEVDGVQFETLMPERTFSIPVEPLSPDGNMDIPVQLGIRITNNTPMPFRFSSYGRLTPELMGADSQLLPSIFLRIRRLKPKESYFPLAMPGESVTLFPNARLIWFKRVNELKISIAKGTGGYWNFDILNPGEYHVRFIYRNENEVDRINDRGQEGTKPTLLERLWTGRVITPFVKFCIVSS
ncbi:hypothetical protein [Microcoleus sp. herbarium5]|uniref:hypothetical protein n=1 Tax=Microcoleus sp. herbarium5 TaxID=3055434 RepID=UPI002FD2D038